MTTKYKRSYRYFYAPVQITKFCTLFVLIIFLLGPFVKPVNGEIPLDFETVRLAILEGVRQNEAQLTCGKLFWTRQTKEDGFISGRRIETQGDYSLYWDGERIATQYEDDKVGPEKSDGTYDVWRSGDRKAFDGKEFRQVRNVENPKDIAISYDVKFRLHENWFESVGWYNKGLYYHILSKPQEFKNYSFEAFNVDSGDKKLLKVIASVTGTETPDTGASMIWYFDPDKGYNLVKEEWLNPDGLLRLTRNLKFLKMTGGVWFPIEKIAESIEPKTQKVTLRNHFKLDLGRSSVNDPSKIPEDVFHIPITPDMEISDYRGGVRINYKQDITPIVMDTLDEIMDDFINEPTETQKTTTTSLSNNDNENEKQTKTTVQIRPPVSDPPEIILKRAVLSKVINVLYCLIVTSGILIIFFAVYRRRRKKKPIS